MRSLNPRTIVVLLILMLIVTPLTAFADEIDGKPVITPERAPVDPGDTFDLEVSVQAWEDANYTVTFANRTRFTFPGALNQTHTLAKGDAILFKVQCVVDDDAPDGDFRVSFKVTWEVNGTMEEEEGEVLVVVGEGAGTSDPCASILLVAPLTIVTFSVLIVRSRRTRPA
jgi:hypothetical protein